MKPFAAQAQPAYADALIAAIATLGRYASIHNSRADLPRPTRGDHRHRRDITTGLWAPGQGPYEERRSNSAPRRPPTLLGRGTPM